MNCIALRHVCFEDLGTFAHLLAARNYTVTYRQAGVSPLTAAEWEGTDLIAVLGGPIGVYETDLYPWLVDELDGLRRRLALRKPTLGICLGAQLMAAALGARVYPGPAKEIGWSELILTPEGQQSSLRHLAHAPVLHWHGDTFDLPAGATLLASTSLTPHQAYALDDFGLALQFHAEADAAAIETWLIGNTCELGHAKISIPELRNETARVGGNIAAAGAAMLTAWLNQLNNAA